MFHIESKKNNQEVQDYKCQFQVEKNLRVFGKESKLLFKKSAGCEESRAASWFSQGLLTNRFLQQASVCIWQVFSAWYNVCGGKTQA